VHLKVHVDRDCMEAGQSSRVCSYIQVRPSELMTVSPVTSETVNVSSAPIQMVLGTTYLKCSAVFCDCGIPESILSPEYCVAVGHH
jgi:hypothetical protein